MTRLFLLLWLFLPVIAVAQQQNQHALGGLEQFPIISGTGGYTYATAQDIANYVGNNTTIPPGANLTPGNVTDGNNIATHSLGVWTSYLTGTLNPNNIVIGGTASLNGGGALSGNFSGSPNFTGSPILTTGTVTATGGNTARTEAAINADLANPFFYGADATGTTDSATAINQAAANSPTRTVHLSGGTFKVNSQINLSNGQCLYGDGDHITYLVVDQNFSSSANGVISLAGFEDGAPCVHDLAIQFTQPPDTVTTVNGAVAAGQSTITLTSGANISNGFYISDTTTAGAIPPNATVTISGNVVTLSSPLTGSGVLNGDTIRLGASRANYLTLAGGCTTSVGGTGCKYPPAIYAPSSATNRIRLWNLHVECAWDGFALGGDVPWMTNIEMGSIDVGWSNDGAQDFSHVKGWHQWQFCTSSAPLSFTGPFHDGTPIAWQLGRMDGLNAEDVTIVDSIFQITANANNSLTPSQYTNVMMDGNNANLVIQGGLMNSFNNFYRTGVSTVSTCAIDVSAGITTLTTSSLYPAGSQTNYACVSGGTLRVINSVISPANSTITSFGQSGGLMLLDNNYFNPPATISNPLITSSGGTSIITNNTAHTGTSGVAISITTDNSGNSIRNNDFKQYTYSYPAGAVTGFYASLLTNWGGSGGVSTASSNHFISGSGTLTTGAATINFGGQAVFTSSSSYTCVATDVSGSAVTISTQNQSGSQFKVFGTGSDAFRYFCIGS